MGKKYNMKDFFALLAPTVNRISGEGSRLIPSVRLAQSWLETGGMINDWCNLGGYKVGSGASTLYWDGSSVSTKTKEVYNGVTVNTTANWRAYTSFYNYFKDQDLLFMKSRYARVRAAKTPEKQAAMLKECGYATDPHYAGKLVSIINAQGLKQYDIIGEDGEKLELSKYQWTTLGEGIQSLLDRKIITDKLWLEKAKSNKITVSELSWLTFVVAVNK